MRQILLIIFAAAAVDGGTITSGNIDFPNGGFGVGLSGPDFSANIYDYDNQDCTAGGMAALSLPRTIAGLLHSGWKWERCGLFRHELWWRGPHLAGGLLFWYSHPWNSDRD